MKIFSIIFSHHFQAQHLHPILLISNGIIYLILFYNFFFFSYSEINSMPFLSFDLCVCVYFFFSFLSHPFVLLIKRHFRTIDTEENLFFEKINSIIDWICRIENKVVSRICHYSSKIAWNQREFEEIIQGRWIIISIRIIKFQKKETRSIAFQSSILDREKLLDHITPRTEKRVNLFQRLKSFLIEYMSIPSNEITI